MSKAPEFIVEGEEWIPCQPVALSDLQGKVVLIKFWSFMCSWCQEDIPDIVEFEAKYKNDGLVVVGIHTPETTYEKDVDVLKKQIKVLGIDFPVLTDNNKKNWDAYEVENWPAYYLVNKDGHIAFSVLGPGAGEILEDKIKELL